MEHTNHLSHLRYPQRNSITTAPNAEWCTLQRHDDDAATSSFSRHPYGEQCCEWGTASDERVHHGHAIGVASCETMTAS
jgi:hypothetical protein